MSTKNNNISNLLKISPLLPGEDEETYQSGLTSFIEELGATTALKAYIAEKIYDCLWWMRRYEEQKRAVIIAQMGIQLNGGSLGNITKEQIHLREILLANQIDEQCLQSIARKGHSLESLREVAMSKRRGELLQLDNQIALQAKILAGLQASYEVAFNRKRHAERLELQNALLRRDLQAVDGKPVDDKRKTKGG